MGFSGRCLGRWVGCWVGPGFSGCCPWCWFGPGRGSTCQVSTNGIEGVYTLFLGYVENLVFVPETKEILYIPTQDLGK